MKTHYCTVCSSGIIYDGITRPKFCPHCGGSQTNASRTPIINSPKINRQEYYEESSENYDIDSLIRSVSISSENIDKVKLKNVFGVGGEPDTFKRPSMTDKEFSDFQQRIDHTKTNKLEE